MTDETPPLAASGPEGKCHLRLLSWCAGMKLALSNVPINHEGKGLALSYGWLSGCEEECAKPLGVIYHGKARDTGLVLNLCPWCGASLRIDP